MFKKLADQVLGEGWEEQLRQEMFPEPPVQHDVRPSPIEREKERPPTALRPRQPVDEEQQIAENQARPRPEGSARRGARPRPDGGAKIVRGEVGHRMRSRSRPRRLLGTGVSLQQAIILKEILDEPVALHDPAQDRLTGR